MKTKEERLAFALSQRKRHPETVAIHSMVPEWVTLGDNVTIHRNCSIGSQGFGFVWHEDRWLHIPHVGGVMIGDNVEIFPFVNIDRATAKRRYTIIGPGTKLDHHVHIGHNVIVDSDCLIMAGAIIGGGTIVCQRVRIGIGAVIRDGLTIGHDAFIGMGAVVTHNVPDNETWVGNPAKKLN